MLKKTHKSIIFSLVCILIYVSNPVTVLAEAYSYRIGIYGISDHFNETGSKSSFIEQNYGLSVSIPTGVPSFLTIETDFDIGAFRNSYDDLAVCFGLGGYYKVMPGLSLGLNAYHWHTERGTYDQRIMTLYPVAKFYFTDNLAFKTRWSHSSVVASIDLTFK